MRSLIIVSLTLLALAGCKVTVLNSEGGMVMLDGKPFCPQDKTCTHEVTDTSFEGTFTAIPEPGWNFEKWQAAEGFLCEATNPECVVSNVATAAIPGIDAIIASDQEYYVMPIFKKDPSVAVYRTKNWSSGRAFYILDGDEESGNFMQGCSNNKDFPDTYHTFFELIIDSNFEDQSATRLDPDFPAFTLVGYCGTDDNPKLSRRLWIGSDDAVWTGSWIDFDAQGDGSHKLSFVVSPNSDGSRQTLFATVFLTGLLWAHNHPDVNEGVTGPFGYYFQGNDTSLKFELYDPFETP